MILSLIAARICTVNTAYLSMFAKARQIQLQTIVRSTYGNNNKQKGDELMKELGHLLGYRCILLPEYRVQKKTHKNAILNWILKVIFGYTTSYPVKKDMIIVHDMIYFKTEEQYQRAVKLVDDIRNKGGQSTDGRNNVSGLCNENK